MVIAHAQTRYPEWQERGDSASAPVGTHIDIPADAKEEKNGRYRLPNGNYVEKTAYFYVLAMVDGEVKPAVIPMRSSNLSPARELNNLIKNLRFSDDKGSFNPASYAAVYNLKTVVHCYAGINRSSTAIIRYVKNYTDIDWRSAVKYISEMNKQRKNKYFPNGTPALRNSLFLKRLEQLE